MILARVGRIPTSSRYRRCSRDSGQEGSRSFSFLFCPSSFSFPNVRLLLSTFLFLGIKQKKNQHLLLFMVLCRIPLLCYILTIYVYTWIMDSRMNA